jgi:hypothetical protein
MAIFKLYGGKIATCARRVATVLHELKVPFELIAGFGLRLAQDLGLHRHKFKARTSTVAEELEKRAFL